MRIHFDPRTKLLLLLGVNLLLLMSHSLYLELVLILFCLGHLVVSGKGESAFHFLLLFLGMLGLDMGLTPFMSGFSYSIFTFLVVAIRKCHPCLIMGKWILDTVEVAEFIAAMWKLHLPQSVIVPVSVVFRYFPTLGEEWRSIRGAMKLRGIHLSFEHVIVPILMSAVNISEELSAAAVCRGIDNPEKHTCMTDVRIGRADVISIGVLMMIALVLVGLKGVGIL